MLFDTSIWIDFLNGKNIKGASLLQTDIREFASVHICPPVYQEILQGIRDERKYQETKDLLFSLNFLSLDPFFAADGALNLYRQLRKKGVTIRKPNDCLIAFYAIHFKIKLVHNDSDFDSIGKHTPLKIYTT